MDNFDGVNYGSFSLYLIRPLSIILLSNDANLFFCLIFLSYYPLCSPYYCLYFSLIPSRKSRVCYPLWMRVWPWFNRTYTFLTSIFPPRRYFSCIWCRNCSTYPLPLNASVFSYKWINSPLFYLHCNSDFRPTSWVIRRFAKLNKIKWFKIELLTPIQRD